MELVRGMDEAAVSLGYHLIITGSHNRERDTIEAISMLRSRVDALLVISPNVPSEAIAAALPTEIPVVSLFSPRYHQRDATFLVSNERGAGLAVQHLVELGHTRIGFITGPEANVDSRERYRGYLNALQDHGLPHDSSLVAPGSFTVPSGMHAMERLLRLSEPPTAVFAGNDFMAIGALKALHRHGLRVPDDVALIGFDDVPMAQLMSPSLSTIHVPIYDIGYRAVYHAT
ncbi:MAG: substrate-binding domain-containing protein, partial [Bacteroidota bacterium]